MRLGLRGARLASTSASASASAASASTSAAQQYGPGPGATTHYRITLRRSAIGLPSKTGRVLESLGLTRRLQSVIRPQRADMAGAILAVKELVHVDTVRRLDAPTQEHYALMEMGASPNAVLDLDAVWVDEKGEVVSWGAAARKAPRGYRVTGNLVSPARDAEVKLRRESEE